jgi:threonine aldolase
LRKALGGGMRQAGILAAAGLQALDDFESGILNLDHIHAKRLKNCLTPIDSTLFFLESPLFHVRNQVDTNILFIEIGHYDKTQDPAAFTSTICRLFKERGILVSYWSPLLLRMVLHRDILEEDILRVIEAIQSRGTYVPIPSGDPLLAF